MGEVGEGSPSNVETVADPMSEVVVKETNSNDTLKVDDQKIILKEENHAYDERNPGNKTDLVGEDQCDKPSVMGCRTILDDIELNIDNLRKSALLLLSEKEELLTTLKSIEDEKANMSEIEREEIKSELDRLEGKLRSVEVKVVESRVGGQQLSFDEVDEEIGKLISILQNGNLDDAEMKCRAYLTACGEEGRSTDDAFENLLLGCSIGDQKEVKKRLKCLLQQILALKD